MQPQKTVIVGAGPVGALAAMYAAERGHEVEVYELRNDLRDPSTTPLNFSKSINLALSERGINAMRGCEPYSVSGEHTALLERVFRESIPMRGRMIHGKTATGELYEQAQDYDIHGRTIFAVDRGGLNRALLDQLEGKVKFFFNHKMTGADFRKGKAWFKDPNYSVGSDQEIEVDFDVLIGADGAHSSARYHMMKAIPVDYKQEYIDTLWCEFTIPPKSNQVDEPDAKFAISPNHLHIWPGQEFMFIGIPSNDGSFTCTLFLSSSHFADLEPCPEKVPAFFDKHFPGVTSLITPQDIIHSFTHNPHQPLINIKCSPYHYTGRGVIVGDAAHAMVPFYGQGMNAGLEDVRVLFSILDKHTSTKDGLILSQSIAERERALKEYSETRVPDAHAINDLALDNYKEMRSSVTDPVYKFRKWLEERMSVYMPSLGWATKYSRVSFGNEPYSGVIRKTDRQGKILIRCLISLLFGPLMAGGIYAFLRFKKAGGTIFLGFKKP